MTIIYVDFVSGNDTTGDGTYSLPYKTLGKADDGLTGGDEIRVAGCTMTTLSGTLTWVSGSKNVTTSVDQTSAVAAGDVVGKNDATGGWWVVDSVDAAKIVLEQTYYGTDEATTGYKMTPVSPGASNTCATSGSSTSSRLKVSGGWNLSTQTRSGFTVANNVIALGAVYYVEFCYFVSTYAGVGISSNTSSYYCYMHDLHCTTPGASTASMQFSGHHHNIENFSVVGYTGPTLFQVSGNYNTITSGFLTNTSTGMTVTGCFNKIDDLLIYGFSSYGLTFSSGSSKNFFENSTIKNLSKGSSCGINFTGNCDNRTSNITFNTLSSAYYVSSRGPNFAINSTLTNVDTEYSLAPTFPNYFQLNTSDGSAHKRFSYYCKAISDTVYARTGTCLKIYSDTPTLDYLPFIEIGKLKVELDTDDIILSIFVREGSLFTSVYHGEFHIWAVQDGALVAGVERILDLTTSYAERTLTVPAASLTVGSYITMYGVVSRDTGSFDDNAFIAIDDFSYSQG